MSEKESSKEYQLLQNTIKKSKQMLIDQGELWTSKEVSRRLGVSLSWLHSKKRSDWIERRWIVKDGNRCLWTENAIKEVIKFIQPIFLKILIPRGG